MKNGQRVPAGRLGRLVALGVGGLLAACDTRDRLTFPNQGGPPNSGPVTIIDRPAADTTVLAASGNYSVTGRTTDADGLDTVYFETEGGISSFQPFIGGGDTVRFGLPITVTGLAGATITVRVFGTDRLGLRGDSAVRVITVQ